MSELSKQLETVDLTPEFIENFYTTALQEWSPESNDTLERFEKAVEMSRRIGFIKGEAYALGLIGYHHFIYSRLESALQILLESRSLAEKSEDEETISTVLAILGMVHRSLGNLDESFSLMTESERRMSKLKQLPMYSWLLYNLAGNYEDFGDFGKATATYERALKCFRRDKEGGADKVRANVGIGRSLNGIATVLQTQGELDKALEYHNEALKFFEPLDNYQGIARVYNDIGEIYRLKKDLRKAEEYHRQALALRQNLTMKQAVATSLINLGRVLAEQDNHKEGLQTLHNALDLAMEIKAKIRIYEANLALATAYERSKEYDKALQHFKLYHDAREAVYSDEANARVRNLQISHEVESAEQTAEIERLKNTELREKNEQLQQVVTDLTAAQHQLVQSEKMAALGSLVAGLVHEMNSPLGALRGSTDVSNRCMRVIDEYTSELMDSEPRLAKHVNLLKENSGNVTAALDRLAGLLHHLKTFVRLDEADFQRVDIHEGIESSLELIGVAKSGNVEIVREYDEIPAFGHYPGEINQVFMTLLKNAVEAIPDGGKVSIRTQYQDDMVLITISDTGDGIPSAQLEHVFEPTFGAKGSRIKAGMGLFSAYNIVKKHEGEIEIKSELGKGTKVIVELPTTLKPANG